ncbi:hypothetical protein SDC9_73948 [bioreactor metagenome]|uniref:Uncharacterized protein n=1 Tax=bioreactor metagenome TaxID=1076179 RepID=A0A644YGN2_9ZZZZ
MRSLFSADVRRTKIPFAGSEVQRGQRLRERLEDQFVVHEEFPRQQILRLKHIEAVENRRYYDRDLFGLNVSADRSRLLGFLYVSRNDPAFLKARVVEHVENTVPDVFRPAVILAQQIVNANKPFVRGETVQALFVKGV